MTKWRTPDAFRSKKERLEDFAGASTLMEATAANRLLRFPGEAKGLRERNLGGRREEEIEERERRQGWERVKEMVAAIALGQTPSRSPRWRREVLKVRLLTGLSRRAGSRFGSVCAEFLVIIIIFNYS